MSEKLEQEFLLKAQSLWQKNQKIILGVLGAIIVVFGGWFVYSNYFQKPAEEKAAEAIFKAEQYFAQDSSRKVLEGDGVNKGVLYVIKNHSGTKAANLAHYYAGVSYLKLGEFTKAVDQLKDFSTSSKPLQMVSYGALADAYSELNKKDDALTYYKKAGEAFIQDENSSAEYLFRAALLSETMNKNKEALELYKEIKTKFPKAKGGDIDKYINRLEVQKNELSVN